MNLKKLKNTPPWEWPDNADSLLRNILIDRSAKASDRILAAELAGDLTVMNDELADILLTIAESDDEPESLRSEAVVSLGPALEYSYTMEFEDPESDPVSEEMFGRIQRSLKRLYSDTGLSDSLRRMVLEASAQAPEEWHTEAVREAYYNKDDNWRLTAVFCMSSIRGFEGEIMESIKSEDPELLYQAVRAAGNSQLDAAWPNIAALIQGKRTEKPLRLAAIEAIPNIRPHETPEILGPLLDSKDEDLVEAAMEALTMAEGIAEIEDWDEDEDED